MNCMALALLRILQIVYQFNIMQRYELNILQSSVIKRMADYIFRHIPLMIFYIECNAYCYNPLHPHLAAIEVRQKSS